MLNLFDLEAEVARRIAALQAEAVEARRAAAPRRVTRPAPAPAAPLRPRPAGALAGKEAA